jgi:predicted nuclease of predicted toxin-antitoxin system
VHRFLIDAQLPPALARQLAAAGHAATHVLDVGLLEASDSQIWDYALANGTVILTKDEDSPFARLSARTRRRSSGSGLAIAPTQGCWRGSNGKCPP